MPKLQKRQEFAEFDFALARHYRFLERLIIVTWKPSWESTMRTVSLGNHSLQNDGGIEITGCPAENKWWMRYLAWQAATPRNWIECRLEPPTVNNFHIQAIDTATPEEDSVAKSYPVNAGELFWTIICLDGAPERMQHTMETNRHLSVMEASWLTAAAEEFFCCLALKEACKSDDEFEVLVKGDWRDGLILGSRCLNAASRFVSATALKCHNINYSYCLSWDLQFHVRAGTSRTVRGAFDALLQTKRDQYCLNSDCYSIGIEKHEFLIFTV